MKELFVSKYRTKHGEMKVIIYRSFDVLLGSEQTRKAIFLGSIDLEDLTPDVRMLVEVNGAWSQSYDQFLHDHAPKMIIRRDT